MKISLVQNFCKSTHLYFDCAFYQLKCQPQIYELQDEFEIVYPFLKHNFWIDYSCFKTCESQGTCYTGLVIYIQGVPLSNQFLYKHELFRNDYGTLLLYCTFFLNVSLSLCTSSFLTPVLHIISLSAPSHQVRTFKPVGFFIVYIYIFIERTDKNRHARYSGMRHQKSIYCINNFNLCMDKD